MDSTADISDEGASVGIAPCLPFEATPDFCQQLSDVTTRSRKKGLCFIDGVRRLKGGGLLVSPPFGVACARAVWGHFCHTVRALPVPPNPRQGCCMPLHGRQRVCAAIPVILLKNCVSNIAIFIALGGCASDPNVFGASTLSGIRRPWNLMTGVLNDSEGAEQDAILCRG